MFRRVKTKLKASKAEASQAKRERRWAWREMGASPTETHRSWQETLHFILGAVVIDMFTLMHST